MVNGREYEFEDMTLILGGRDVTGFRGIKYKKSQEKEALYGKGNKALSIQKGNEKCDGEISLTQSEYETLRVLGGGFSLTLLPCINGDPTKGDAMLSGLIQFLSSQRE